MSDPKNKTEKMRVPMILPHELLNFLSEPGICRTFCFHESLGCPVESKKKQILFVVKAVVYAPA